MSKMSELVLEIQEMAHDMGDDYGFDAETVLTISRVLQVPVETVQAALDTADIDADYEYDDVDADADALASAGFGTDEDYGYYGEEY